MKYGFGYYLKPTVNNWCLVNYTLPFLKFFLFKNSLYAVRKSPIFSKEKSFTPHVKTGDIIFITERNHISLKLSCKFRRDPLIGVYIKYPFIMSEGCSKIS